MRKQTKTFLLLGLLGLILASCSSKQETINPIQGNISIEAISIENKGNAFYGNLTIMKVMEYSGGDTVKEPVVLVDNSTAENPTYSGLMAFLESTKDERESINSLSGYGTTDGGPLYTCGYYVEDLHNLAETYGIRAGIVLLKSGESHGVNVFDTEDKGPIYVDSSYFEDRVFTELNIGDWYEIYGKSIKIEDIAIIWEGQYDKMD